MLTIFFIATRMLKYLLHFQIHLKTIERVKKKKKNNVKSEKLEEKTTKHRPPYSLKQTYSKPTKVIYNNLTLCSKIHYTQNTCVYC